MSGSCLKHYTYWCPGETATRCTELQACYPQSIVDGVWTALRREGIRGSKLLAIWASSARLFDPHLFTCGVRVWTDGPGHVRRVPGNVRASRRVPAGPPRVAHVPGASPYRGSVSPRCVPPSLPRADREPRPNAPRRRGKAYTPSPARSRAIRGRALARLLGRIGELRCVGAVVPHLARQGANLGLGLVGVQRDEVRREASEVHVGDQARPVALGSGD